MTRVDIRLPGLAGAALLLVSLLNGCTVVGPDFERPRVPWLSDWTGGSLESEFRNRGIPSGATSPAWWRSFNDPVLDALISEAQRANPSVRTAGLRIMEARAQLAIAGSTLYPQVRQVTADVFRAGQNRAGGPDTSMTVMEVGPRISWELDFWGKFQRSIEAADASYLASIAQYDDLQVLMAAQVASLYCTIRTLEARLQVVRENTILLQRSLEITERLFKRGQESELDMQQARTLYLNTLASVPPLQSGLRQAQNALGTLLARAPGPLPEMASRTGVIPQAELGVIVDMPADLLRRRPDVRTAEMQLAAQSAMIGVSAADLYPSISLLGSVGLSVASGAANTVSWAIGPSLVWNVFDRGRLTYTVLVQDARFQQLHEQYQDAVLRAAREVDDSAVSFARTGEQVLLLADTVEAAQRSLRIATLQYREGLADFQRVIDSQRVLFAQQDLLVATQGGLAQSLIALYKAMGGGWEAARGQPVLDDATYQTMSRRIDWKGLLDGPLPPVDAETQSRPAGGTGR